MDSILFLYKPEGVSSAGILNRIKKQYNISTLGHAGTLDPFATGMLIVGKNRGTKTLPYFQNLPKEYIATVKIGIQTDTDDITGQIIKECDKIITQKMLENILPQFLGNIQQVPPKYSALKIHGQRAYKLARNDIEFEIPTREVCIDNIQLLNFSEEKQEFQIKIHCSTGTYIRSLGRDIGLELGTFATLQTLERTAIGQYNIQQSSRIEEITENSFIPIPEVFQHLNSFILKEQYYLLVMNGAAVRPDFLGIYSTQQQQDGYSPSYYLLWRNSKEFIGIVDNRTGRFFYRKL